MTSHRMRRSIGERFVEVIIDLGLKEYMDIFLAVMTDMLRRGRVDERLWRKRGFIR